MDASRGYKAIKDRLKTLLDLTEGWEKFPVLVKPLTTVQAIGEPEGTDYPLLRGKEVLLEATVFRGRGQAFTNAPTNYEGTLQEVLEFELNSNSRRAIFIATLNAVLNHLGVATATVHCRDKEPDQCGPEIARAVKKKHGLVPVGIVGYQPSIISGCVQEFGKDRIRVTDMDMANIGTNRLGVEIWDGVAKTDELMAKSAVLLITGTTFVNGTAFELLAKTNAKPVYFYGTTAAGVVALMEYDRLCFFGKN